MTPTPRQRLADAVAALDAAEKRHNALGVASIDEYDAEEIDDAAMDVVGWQIELKAAARALLDAPDDSAELAAVKLNNMEAVAESRGIALNAADAEVLRLRERDAAWEWLAESEYSVRSFHGWMGAYRDEGERGSVHIASVPHVNGKPDPVALALALGRKGASDGKLLR